MPTPAQAHRRARLPDIEEYQAPGGNVAALERPNVCSKCRWATPNTRPDSFKCRRWPPTVHQSRPGEALFPIVEKDDWCGEFSQ